MRSLQSARYFWHLFTGEQRRETHDPLEHKRYLCLLGFTALEGAIASWWEAAIIPQWEEMLSLTDGLLKSDEDLNLLVTRSAGSLEKSQLVATLRFLKSTGELDHFSPSLCDVGCTLLIFTHLSASEPHAVFARELIRAQRLRDLVVHVGRGLNELEAHEAVKTIKRLADQGPHAHPLFFDAFGRSAAEGEELAA
jgi:hypothetical protein